MEVFKFGGLALQNAEAIRNVGRIIGRQKGRQLLIVVSAIGKNTRLLCRLAEASYNDTKEKDELLDLFISDHQIIMAGLDITEKDPAYAEIQGLFMSLKNQADTNDPNFKRYFDGIISHGELISSRIVSAYLQHSGIPNIWTDIRGILATDNNYTAAKIDHQKSKSLAATAFEEKGIYLTQGFIGRSSESHSITLGFEGSDYTAAVLANYLDASKLTIWKDVPGIMSADPKKETGALKLNRLSYRDVIEYAYAGAKVLHPKTIKPLQNKNIPLEVKSFLQAEENGTLITNEEQDEKQSVFVLRKNQHLIRFMSRDYSFMLEDHMVNILNICKQFNLPVNLMNHTAISMDIVTDKSEQLKTLAGEFEDLYHIEIIPGLELHSFFNCSMQDVSEKTAGCKVLLRIQNGNACRILCKPKNTKS